MDNNLLSDLKKNILNQINETLGLDESSLKDLCNLTRVLTGIKHNFPNLCKQIDVLLVTFAKYANKGYRDDDNIYLLPDISEGLVQNVNDQERVKAVLHKILPRLLFNENNWPDGTLVGILENKIIVHNFPALAVSEKINPRLKKMDGQLNHNADSIFMELIAYFFKADFTKNCLSGCLELFDGKDTISEVRIENASVADVELVLMLCDMCFNLCVPLHHLFVIQAIGNDDVEIHLNTNPFQAYPWGEDNCASGA